MYRYSPIRFRADHDKLSINLYYADRQQKIRDNDEVKPYLFESFKLWQLSCLHVFTFYYYLTSFCQHLCMRDAVCYILRCF